jgi:hypothetical protein
MRQAEAPAAPTDLTYRSYVHIEMQDEQQAVVVEKFHLFWQRGLRFSLRRTAADWHIVGIELVL